MEQVVGHLLANMEITNVLEICTKLAYLMA